MFMMSVPQGVEGRRQVDVPSEGTQDLIRRRRQQRTAFIKALKDSTKHLGEMLRGAS